jgi:hypothetical protein
LCTARSVFDLEDQPWHPPVRRSEARIELAPQRLEVGFVLHERVADEIGVGNDDVEVGAILVGEGRQAEVGPREVEALSEVLVPVQPESLAVDRRVRREESTG